MQKSDTSVQETSELIDRLNLSGKALSKGHRRIAAYICEHYEKAAFMTAGALGAACSVSESTVVRFAVTMGYEGYPELREALNGLVRQRLTSEQRVAIASDLDQDHLLETVLRNDAGNIRRTMESISQNDFENAVRQLLEAKKIYVMGLRSSSPLAQFFYLYLHQIHPDVILVQNALGDVFEEIAQITQNDILVGISYPRYSTRTVEAMHYAKQRGAHTIALTDGEMSPLKAISDVCLCASTDMASFVDSLTAPLSVINALIISIGLNRKKELAEHFRQMESIWNAHDVYIEEHA